MTPAPGTFSGLAHVEDHEDGTHATLLEALAYTTRDGWTLTVPAGFVTDYASIPRGLWNLIPPRGRYNRAAMVHDFLYQQAPLDPATGRLCTRARADAVLREGCEQLHVRGTQTTTIWLGVRLGGWLTWRGYRAGTKPAPASLL